MASSSITGATEAPRVHKGTDIDTLGPSDTSDSGSDVQGEQTMATSPDNPGEWGALTARHDSDTDSMGTGARGSAAGPDVEAGADIMPDRIVDASGVEIDADEVTDEDARNLGVLGIDGAAEAEAGTAAEDEAADPERAR